VLVIFTAPPIRAKTRESGGVIFSLQHVSEEKPLTRMIGKAELVDIAARLGLRRDVVEEKDSAAAAGVMLL
jgi:hypothetical protein